METGFDIIFFWVARMIMFGLEFMDEVPFKEVLYHAMIRDEKGQKMSKTRGNVIDPLVITEKYGVDTLRFTLASMAGRARDIKLAESTIEGYGHFMNKIWQASRFVFSNAEGFESKTDISKLKYPLNRWIISRLNSVTKELNQHFDNYELNDASEKLYKFFWHEFCDWYIEFSKPMLNNEASAGETKYILLYIHREYLKLLHPIAPFITEKLYLASPLCDNKTVMLAKYPEVNQELINTEVETDLMTIQELISNIRNIKITYGINAKNDVMILSRRYEALINDLSGPITKLAGLRSIQTVTSTKEVDLAGSLRALLPDLEIYLPAKEFIDFEKEIARLNKKLESVSKDLNMVNSKLGNQGFLSKASTDVIEKEKAKLNEFTKLDTELKSAIKMLESVAG